MLAFLEKPRLINHERGLRIAQMLDHIGAQILPDSLRIPHGTPQQMLHAIGRRIAVDFRQLPAVFTLHGAEQAPDRGPGAVTSVTAGKVGHEPSFHLGQPEGPCTHRLQRQVGWRRALLLS